MGKVIGKGEVEGNVPPTQERACKKIMKTCTNDCHADLISARNERGIYLMKNRLLEEENANLRDALCDMVAVAESHGWDNAEIHNAREALAGVTPKNK